MTPWLVMFGMGAVTFAIRVWLLDIVHPSSLPGAFRRSLRYVMPAVLSAIIVPAVFYAGERNTFDASLGNERLVAAVLAAAVAWVTGNVYATIAIGMAALWTLEILS